MRRRSPLPFLIAAVLIIAALLIFLLPRQRGSRPVAAGSVSAALQNPDPGDWPMFRRSYDGSSYSPLDKITKDNVTNLQFVWSAPINPGRLESAPIVVNKVMYVPQPGDIVQAINAQTGDLIWQYRRELPDDVDEVKFPVDPAVRNLAFDENNVFFSTADAYVMALEASTGKIAWETQAGDYLETTHAAGPIVVKGRVITGRICKSGPCFVLAHDAKTGAEVWRKNLSEEDGAGAWMVPSYDAELNLLFWGTATDTLALNPDNGEQVWSFKHAPGGENAYERLVVNTEVTPDAGEVKWVSPKVAGSEVRKVLTGVPGNNGLVYTLDAKTGEFLWARETVAQNSVSDLNKETGEATAGDTSAGLCPGKLGGKSWTASAYSPSAKAIYIPLVNACADNSGNHIVAPGSDKLGRLEAISAATGKTLWKFEHPSPLGSVLATAGGLIFVGDFSRRFHALDAETGKELWDTTLAGPITGYPFSYAVEGKQYIAVPGGGNTELEALMPLVPGHKNLPGVNSVYVFSIE